jgi:hypothetical protein
VVYRRLACVFAKESTGAGKREGMILGRACS